MFAATTGSRPARHSATTSGAQSHQSEGITAASRPAQDPGQLGVRERAGELDDAALVERQEPLGERPRDLAVDADAQVAVDQLRRLDQQLRALVRDRPSRRSRRSGDLAVRPGRRSRPTASQIASSSGIAWWTTSSISAGKPRPIRVRRIASDTARMRSTRSENRSRSSLRRSA